MVDEIGLKKDSLLEEGLQRHVMLDVLIVNVKHN